MSVTRRITSSDGTEIAIYEAGPPDAETLVCIHGYPDNHGVWNGVVDLLQNDLHVVTYDVRGAGSSGKPRGRSAYTLAQLEADFAAVLDAVSPERPVHLLAHDWGSIQGWHVTTSADLAGRIASYTSISGPDLDHVGQWMQRNLRGGPRGIGRAVRQLAHSYYIGLFQLPLLPEAVMRTSFAQRVVASAEGAGRSSQAIRIEYERSTPDFVNGIQLYRANMRKHLAGPTQRRTDVPVQVLAPAGDIYVGTDLQQQAPAPFASDLRTRILPGGHWLVTQRPDVIARATKEFVEHVLGGPESRSLAKARAGSGRFGARLAVVTGAGSGMGRQVALELARQGADLVVADINEVSVKETAELIRALGVDCWDYRLDVADAEAWDRFGEQVRAEHGVPDIVVNNAGIGMAGGFLDTSQADWQRILGINFWGVLQGSRVFAAQLVERGEGGHIVNIASAAAYSPSRVMVAYSTTKAAVLMLSECLAADLARDGVMVSAICPGIVDTDISRTTAYVGLDAEAEAAKQQHAVKSYQRRNYSPEKAAKRIVESIGSGRQLVTVTPEAKVLLGLDRWAPALQRRLARADLTKR